MTIDRGKLLDVAARVYGEYGFRGATTRRIADEAGVNEITIFRQFGSKESLINEAIRTHSIRPRLPDLPLVPVDPEQELTIWGSAVLAHLSDVRSLIRRLMSEMDERPGVAPSLGDGPMYSRVRLREYVERLREHGFLPDTPPPLSASAGANGAEAPQSNGAPPTLTEETDVTHAAVAMLMSAFFADAMGREVMPAMYPQPAERAAGAYVSLFLRALGMQITPTIVAPTPPTKGAGRHRPPAP